MKKLQQGASLTVQSNSKQFYSTCWLYAGTSESFKLSTYPNSNPSSVYGKNYSRNQKKREQLAASGVLNPVLNLTPSPTPAAIMGLSPSPVVAQPARQAAAEAMSGLDAQQGSRAEDGAAQNSPGYHTTE